MIKDKNMLNAFNNRSTTLIEVGDMRKPKALYLLEYLNRLFPELFHREIKRIFNINDEVIIHIMDQTPNNLMNEIEKEWVHCLLISRKQWLIEWNEEVR